MTWMVTAVRRSLWLVVVGAVGGVAWSWWRDRTAPPTPPSPPEWPPLRPSNDSSTEPPGEGSAGDEPSADNASVVDAAPTVEATVGTVPSDDGSAASFVNALVDTPDARSPAATGAWLPPEADGACPDTHPIKANDNSGIFHVPGGRFYDRTRAERCYASAADAIADGYRPAKA